MAEQEVPPWVTFILDRVDGQFETLGKRIDGLVTRDAFLQEQSRVNEKLSIQDNQLSDLKTALQAEATARVNSEQSLARERSQEQKDREKEQANRRWLVFSIIATPFVTAFMIWVLNGGLQTAPLG